MAGAGDVLTEARGELRAAPPDAFVETRKQLAARLVAGGHREEAAELRKERRPQLGAWGVNQLVDAAAQELVDLIEVSDRLAELLGDSLDGDAAVELRESMRERQQLLQELADRADAAMRAAGHPGHRDEMLATIDAASMDDTYRTELLDGRLAKVLPPPARFGPVVPAAASAATTSTEARRTPAVAPVTELRPVRDDAGADARGATTKQAQRERERQEREEARVAQRIERATAVVSERTAEAELAIAERETADQVNEIAAARVADAEADLAARARRAAARGAIAGAGPGQGGPGDGEARSSRGRAAATRADLPTRASVRRDEFPTVPESVVRREPVTREPTMSRLIVTEFMTLDGVMEAPGGEPTHPHAGWVMEYFGPEQNDYKLAETLEAGSLLIGRNTYETFAASWPSRDGEFADKMNSMPKYVVSSTLSEPLAWNNSKLVGADLVAEVRRLKGQGESPILVAGSATLVRSLIEHDLIDELRLMIFPVFVGGGLRFYPESRQKHVFALADTRKFATGVVVNTYTRSD